MLTLEKAGEMILKELEKHGLYRPTSQHYHQVSQKHRMAFEGACLKLLDAYQRDLLDSFRRDMGSAARADVEILKMLGGELPKTDRRSRN